MQSKWHIYLFIGSINKVKGQINPVKGRRNRFDNYKTNKRPLIADDQRPNKPICGQINLLVVK